MSRKVRVNTYIHTSIKVTNFTSKKIMKYIKLFRNIKF